MLMELLTWVKLSRDVSVFRIDVCTYEFISFKSMAHNFKNLLIECELLDFILDNWLEKNYSDLILE